MTDLYITIDTEYEAGFTAQRGPDSRRENFARSIEGRTPQGSVGVGYQMDVLDAHGLKAVFFVDPMPALLWGVGAIADVVEPIVARGHDVQLHLHTEWLALAGAANPLKMRTGRNLKDFSFEEQCELIDYAARTLTSAGACRPVAFRAGNYGANDDTLRALAELDLAYDTSLSPGFGTSDCAITLDSSHREPVRHLGVIEVPIGCIGGARNLRHAQIVALSSRELRSAIEYARDNGHREFTLVSHSFELLSRDRTRINRIVRHRFDRLCEAVGKMPGVDTACYATKPPAVIASPRPRQTRPHSLIKAGIRFAEQALVNALYGSRATH